MLTNSACNSLKIGSGYSDGEQAYYAAVFGLEYARSRFSLNGNWMEKIYSHQTECLNSEDPDRPGGYNIRIFEKAGIVTGYLGMEPNSARSMFIIRFVSTNQTPANPNIEASSEFVDMFGTKRQIHSLSCNNMSGSTPIKCISGSGKENQLPPAYAFISVQGVCRNSVKYAEALLSNEGSTVFSGSSLSRGSIDVDLKGSNPMFVMDSTSNENNIRTLNNISVSAPFANALVMKKKGTAYADKFVINQQDLSDKKEFEKLGFNLDTNNSSTIALLNSPSLKDEITFSALYSAQNNEPAPQDGSALPVESLSNSTTDITPGAYIFDGTRWLKYNCTFSTKEGADKAAPIITDTKGKENPYPEIFTVKEGRPYVNINKKREIGGSVFIGAVDKINEILHPLLKEEENTDSSSAAVEYTIKNSDLSSLYRPTVVFSDNSALIVGKENSSSDFILQGSMIGKGKLLVNGDVYMQGGSYFETEPNSGVAVYAENNVNLVSATAGDVNGLSEAAKAAWNNFYQQTGGTIQIPSDVENTNYLKEAAEKLLDCQINTGGDTFSKFLADNKCADRDDQIKFAESFISQNSAIFNSDSTDAGSPTVVTYSYTTGKLSTETKTDSDTIKNWNWTGDMNENPLMNYIGSSSNDWCYNYSNAVSYSPYRKRIDTRAFPRWLSLTDQNIADENLKKASDYLVGNGWWYNNYNPLNSNFLISADFIKTGQEYDSFSEKFLSKAKATQDYIQVWVHEKLSAGEPNDLFITIPVNGGTSQARYGYDRYCDGYKGRTYAREKNASCTAADVSFTNGKLKINFENIFKKLDDKNFQEADSENNGVITYKNKNSDSADSSYRYMKKTLERCSYFKWDKELIFDIADNMIVGLSQNSAYSDSLKGSTSMVLKESADGTGLVLPNKNNTNVKGFIFAREGNFNTNIGMGSLTILGGIVSYNGKINVSAGSFNLKYDPNYMQFVNASGIKTGYLYQNVFNP